MVRAYNYIIEDLIENHAPLLKKVVHNIHQSSWMSFNILDEKHVRYKSEHLLRHKKTDENHLPMIFQRNEVVNKNTTAKIWLTFCQIEYRPMQTSPNIFLNHILQSKETKVLTPGDWVYGLFHCYNLQD